MPPSDEIHCPNCGSALVGKFCINCGEARPDRSHLSFRNFARYAIEEITDYQHSKILTTVRDLTFRPGELTLQFLQGATKRYLGPLKLYLAVFALNLFLYSIYQPAAIYDVRSLLAQDGAGNWQKLITATATAHGATEATTISDINGTWQKYLSFSQLLYPVALASALSLLYWRARRFYIEHLVFATHVLAFSFLLAIFLWPIYAVVGVSMWTNARYVMGASLAIILVYIILALRRVYQQGWGWTLTKGMILNVLYFVITGAITVASLSAALYAVARSAPK